MTLPTTNLSATTQAEGLHACRSNRATRTGWNGALGSRVWCVLTHCTADGAHLVDAFRPPIAHHASTAHPHAVAAGDATAGRARTVAEAAMARGEGEGDGVPAVGDIGEEGKGDAAAAGSLQKEATPSAFSPPHRHSRVGDWGICEGVRRTGRYKD
jgi:hypothetical protein